MSDIPSSPIFESFKSEDLGEYLLLRKKKGDRNFVTFLIGAGFSKSAGVPLAGEIVKELREEAKDYPLLRDVGPTPDGMSEYAFLMLKLGSSKERAERIKGYINRARDAENRFLINWSHLLLATLVEGGYVNRILTTNFDPLVVEALAVTGQPIRTYDLNTTGEYYQGAFDPGSVIYLHGQMHSVFLANCPHEMERLAKIYESVLQEAVQDSILIVVGYSGECDPVLDALHDLRSFPRGLWWSQYGGTIPESGSGVARLFGKHGADCHLSTGCDADNFMRHLVNDGMKLSYPDEVSDPIKAARLSLERIIPFPATDNSPEFNPAESSLLMLREAEDYFEQKNPSSAKGHPSANASQAEVLDQNLPLIGRLEASAFNGDWETFDQLRKSIPENPDSSLSNAIGDGFCRRAGSGVIKSDADFEQAISYLQTAEKYGVSKKFLHWLPVIWGTALSDQAELKGDTEGGRKLFSEAYEKYGEAVKIKPDMHEAWSNWGTALSDQAELKGDTEEGRKLFSEAYEKYGEAVKIKPDKHEAWSNWGDALFEQAKLKGDTSQGDKLYDQAYEKCEVAAKIKPDMYEVWITWGDALSSQAKLKGDSPEATRLQAEAEKKFAMAKKIQGEKG